MIWSAVNLRGDPRGLIPVMVAGGSDAPPSVPPEGPAGSSIAVELRGVRIVVSPGVDDQHRVRVLRAVRGAA